jgi:hypothetical protein
MNSKFLLTAIIIAGLTSSCSTVYKSGQTPDDVYYSPVRAEEKKQDTDEEKEDQTKQETAEDRQIRRGIQDRRWRNNDDNDYNYNHNCNCYCNQYGYGYYNHPYYRPVPYYTPKAIVNSTPRMINLGGYNNTVTVTNPKTGVKTTTTRVYNNTNRSNGNGLGNVIRQIFKPEPSSSSNNNNNNNNTNSNNTRTYQPSSTPSSSGGSSSGGSSGGSISRPGKGGK